MIAIMNAHDVSASINLKLLHTFLRVGEEQSFRAAADHTHRSASAVSSQIKSLESQLGLPLFHRTTRNVRLTPEGARLLQCVQRALGEVEQGLQEIRETSAIQRGRVALACAPTLASTYLGEALAVFESQYPGIHVSVCEITASTLYERVRKREVDFGLSVANGSAEFRFSPLFLDELVALVPRSRMMQNRKTISLKSLSTMPLLMLEKGTALRTIVEDAMSEQRLTFNTRFQFMQSQTLVSMAVAGLGAAILPEISLPRSLPRSVQKLRIVNPVLARQMAIVMMKGHVLSPAAEKLVSVLKEVLVRKPAALTGS
jgi:DNA-binding transcriptional LysR family regulator